MTRVRPAMYSRHIRPKRQRYKAEGRCIDCGVDAAGFARCARCRRGVYISHIKSRYGISIEEYETTLKRPCGVCGTTRFKRVLDHNHKTGAVRGALCNPCNAKVGWFEKFKDTVLAWEGRK